MKFARYESHGEVHYGIVEGDSVRAITSSPFEKYELTDHVHKLSDVKLLVPTEPLNLMTTGINALSHQHSDQNKNQFSPKWAERTVPGVSIRNLGSLQNPEEPIIRPDDAPTFREEAELVVVIGKKCHKISKDEVYDHILGYTCGNDVCVKEWEEQKEAWKSKCCDTMHPVGPWIETELDPMNVMIRARVNGKTVQEEATTSYIFDVPSVIARMASYMTLYPGDLIFMGTVGEPHDMKPGDVVEVDIEGIGVLRNPIVADS